MALAIDVAGVSKLYGGERSPVGLRHLDMAVREGEVVALIGPNGAGKTTTVRGLATLLRFDGGSARVAGHDVSADPGRVRQAIGLVGQSAAVDQHLSARQNLVFFGRLRGLRRPEAHARAAQLLEGLGLEDAADKPALRLSGGMRRRLDVAVSLVVRPAVVFVDEPTTGLDPAARRDLWARLRALVREGTTVLLTTQYLEEADALADQVVLLAHGEVVARGTADELKRLVGPATVRMAFASHADTSAAHDALAGTVDGVQPDADGSSLTYPVRGSATSTEGVLRLAEAGIAPLEVEVRRPTLDDVFLTLTGSPATGRIPR
ncbi:ATP-binding cassette domain-containing protein [Georgenia faecalis]|uniref:ATP-binding cassette domain-containing protein n=1 Tax=Georgenia faecalis TaxID=2483799 RepID=UPI000FD99D66|nr:ATP-binding cassette domain-containing protein [Georgenia faecalis]